MMDISTLFDDIDAIEEAGRDDVAEVVRVIAGARIDQMTGHAWLDESGE